jgi:hypothetical protein
MDSLSPRDSVLARSRSVVTRDFFPKVRFGWVRSVSIRPANTFRLISQMTAVVWQASRFGFRYVSQQGTFMLWQER